MHDIFHFDDSTPNFDQLAQQNGFTYWHASDMMKALGYASWSSFEGVVNRAMTACNAAKIDLFDNFEQVRRTVDGKPIRDFKLSRFACYMLAMNGDPNKPDVARAQAYFAVLAEAFSRYVERAEDIERILIREDVSDHEKSMARAAHSAGVNSHGFGLFQNAGYRGLYNMNLAKLRDLKGIPEGRSPLDFMGKTELAANLFRITQTEEKIRTQNIQGQKHCERTAEDVGREVRQTMQRISGIAPEALPIAEDIKKLKGDVKSSHKDFKKLDKLK